jgi:ATP diphosphatase
VNIRRSVTFIRGESSIAFLGPPLTYASKADMAIGSAGSEPAAKRLVGLPSYQCQFEDHKVTAMDHSRKDPTPAERAENPAGDVSLTRLLDLVRRLRAPDGCPWDREQTLDALRAYLLEEAHETADAIDRQDWDDLLAELGDLLFQLCFVCVLAEEQQRFDLDQVVEAIYRKMVDRHPHVFGDRDQASSGGRPETAEQVAQAWERAKRARRTDTSALSGVPTSLPALTGAHRLGQKAAALGFDWERPAQVVDKIREEVAELEEAIAEGGPSEIESELGDLLLSVASLSRHLGCDPERALARANLRFRRRFGRVESALGSRLVDGSMPLDALRKEMERIWAEAKAHEREG